VGPPFPVSPAQHSVTLQARQQHKHRAKPPRKFQSYYAPSNRFHRMLQATVKITTIHPNDASISALEDSDDDLNNLLATLHNPRKSPFSMPKPVKLWQGPGQSTDVFPVLSIPANLSLLPNKVLETFLQDLKNGVDTLQYELDRRRQLVKGEGFHFELRNHEVSKRIEISATPSPVRQKSAEIGKRQLEDIYNDPLLDTEDPIHQKVHSYESQPIPQYPDYPQDYPHDFQDYPEGMQSPYDMQEQQPNHPNDYPKEYQNDVQREHDIKEFQNDPLEHLFDNDFDEIFDPPPTVAPTNAPTQHPSYPSQFFPQTLDMVIPPATPLDHAALPWANELQRILSQTFSMTHFRDGQLEAIDGALSGKDVFVLMPTGGGKSLTFQLPAMISHSTTLSSTRGVTIVITPLISLMQDQVSKLRERGLPVAAWQGMETRTEGVEDDRSTVLQMLRTNQLAFLYITPEGLCNGNVIQGVLDQLHRSGQLARLVIDEAHCVSEWGHNFRPDYVTLGTFRARWPGLGVMALTATATQRVQVDILHQLKMTNVVTVKRSFNRTNLEYHISPKPVHKAKMYEAVKLWLEKQGYLKETGIVYCFSRRQAEEAASALSDLHLSAEAYHAAFSPQDRSDIQERWQNGQTKIVCCTTAFGMGIDKANVRFVVHATLSRSLEGYYQETGRAGRDGKTSKCLLLFTFKDVTTIQRQINQTLTEDLQKGTIPKDKLLQQAQNERVNLARVADYCDNSIMCRRVMVLEYFGEKPVGDVCRKACDTCQAGRTGVMRSVLDNAKSIVGSVQQHLGEGQTITAAVLSKNWSKQFADISRTDAERIIHYLLQQDVLKERHENNNHGGSVSYLEVGPRAADLDRMDLQMPFEVKLQPKSKKRSLAHDDKPAKRLAVETSRPSAIPPGLESDDDVVMLPAPPMLSKFSKGSLPVTTTRPTDHPVTVVRDCEAALLAKRKDLLSSTREMPTIPRNMMTNEEAREVSRLLPDAETFRGMLRELNTDKKWRLWGSSLWEVVERFRCSSGKNQPTNTRSPYFPAGDSGKTRISAMPL
jgi:RecQ family ATP-dependent DNA helicase